MEVDQLKKTGPLKATKERLMICKKYHSTEKKTALRYFLQKVQ